MLLGFITLALLTTSDVLILINYTSFVESLFIAISVAGLLVLRVRSPDLHRPIKVHILLPLIFFVICAFLVVLPVLEEPVLVGYSLAIITSGLPVYAVFIGWKSRPAWLSRFIKAIDLNLQKFFLAAPDFLHLD